MGKSTDFSPFTVYSYIFAYLHPMAPSHKATRYIYISLFLVLLVTTIFFYYLLSQQQQSLVFQKATIEKINTSKRILLLLEKVISEAKDMEIGYFRYQLTHNDDFLIKFYDAKTLLAHQIPKLDSLLKRYGDNADNGNWQLLKKKVNTHYELIENKIDVNSSASSIESEKSGFIYMGMANLDSIQQLAGLVVIDEENTLALNESMNIDHTAYKPYMIAVPSFMALIGFVYLSLLTDTALANKTRSAQQLEEKVGELASEVKSRRFTESLLQKVSDSSLNGIMAFETIRSSSGDIVDFRWLLANPVAEKTLGHTAQELFKEQLLNLVPGIKETGLFHAYKNVVHTGMPFKTEQLYQSDGFDNWFHIMAVKLGDGIAVTFVDITEEKLRQQKIEEQEVLLNQAEKISKMGSWAWNVDSGQVHWSRGTYRINEIPEEATLSSDIFMKNIHHEDIDTMKQVMQKAVAEREDYSLEYRWSDGNKMKHMRVVAKANYNESNDFIGFIGVLHDMSVEKNNRLLLEKQKEELERSNGNLQQFAYVASHDLQEPLRKIRAFGDRLSSKYENQLDKKGTLYIERMQSAAARMQVLIEDLLAYSRVSSSKTKITKENLKTVIEGVREDLQEAIHRSEARITLNDLPKELYCDTGQIRRLFQNLLSNAIKFRKEGQCPIIDVRGSSTFKEELIELRLDPKRQYSCIVVKDNGIGFDEKYLDRIFNVFQRLHGKQEYEGTGIGLAICKKIAENHDGALTASSSLGKGAAFKVIIPTDGPIDTEQNYVFLT